MCICAMEVDDSLIPDLIVLGEQVFSKHYNKWITNKGGWVSMVRVGHPIMHHFGIPSYIQWMKAFQQSNSGISCPKLRRGNVARVQNLVDRRKPNITSCNI